MTDDRARRFVGTQDDVRVFSPEHVYPETVDECIQPVHYRRATRKAVRKYARSRPWVGGFDQRRDKALTLVRELAAAYNVGVPTLNFDRAQPDHYDRRPKTITLRLTDRGDRPDYFSVVTLLHEFGHHLGKNERDTCCWSLNLFRIFFPRSFVAATRDRHMLLRN